MGLGGERMRKVEACESEGQRADCYSVAGRDHVALFALTVWLQNGSDVCGWLILHPCSWPHRISCGAGG